MLINRESIEYCGITVEGNYPMVDCVAERSAGDNFQIKTGEVGERERGQAAWADPGILDRGIHVCLDLRKTTWYMLSISRSSV